MWIAPPAAVDGGRGQWYDEEFEASPQAFDFDTAAFHHETVTIGDLPDI
jgi:hypothetical protein